jgi:hypothetical protein
LPSPRSFIASALLSLALMLAAANVWFALSRSTIPLRLDATVMHKEVRHEKHPPKDDVCLLDLGPAGTFQVDQELFDRVAVGQRLVKAPWSRQLQASGQTIELRWSADTRGMIWAMPLVCIVMLAAWWGGCRIGAVS